MNIKITFDPDGVYGYPKDGIIDGKQLVNDYIDTLNEVEDANTISFLKSSEIEKAVDFVAEMWSLNYDIIPDDKVIRKCSVCGKQITEGYVFDGTDCFCSKECATNFFDNDEGCVDILIDEGERLIWMDSLPTAPHYKVGIGADNPNNFFYCDTKDKLFEWINSRVFQTIKDWYDIETYNDNHKSARIEVILFYPKNYYEYRKKYVSNIHKCNDLMLRCQCITKSPKRDRILYEFSRAYNDADALWDMYPEVWQGEI
jgi:hypothetical protein